MTYARVDVRSFVWIGAQVTLYWRPHSGHQVARFDSKINAKTVAFYCGNEASSVCRHDRLFGCNSPGHREQNLCIRETRAQSKYRVVKKSLYIRVNILNIKCQVTFVSAGVLQINSCGLLFK